ncbi:hypothetical protein [Spiractinospora alimapuensis]|nr:hypothetical protein [Spiractinospora alimapuensis]
MTSQPRRGPLAWIVFVVAILAALVLIGGCVAVAYGDAFALM